MSCGTALSESEPPSEQAAMLAHPPPTAALDRLAGPPTAPPAQPVPPPVQPQVALDQQKVTAVHEWLMRLRQVDVGGSVGEGQTGSPMYVLGQFGLQPADAFVNTGFGPVPGTEGAWQRLCDLDGVAGSLQADERPLVLSTMPSMPAVDAIVISSVHRPQTSRVYLYDTLRSTLANFPPQAQINVMVGSAQAGYVDRQHLVAEVGEANSRRIHVFPTPPAEARYLAELKVSRRGGWNFSRSLLKYHGSRGIVLLEDDVQWADQGPAMLQALVENTPLPILSLYNQLCEALPGRQTVATAGALSAEHPSRSFGIKWFSQGFYVAAVMARALGEHQLIHLNDHCWDGLIDNFLVAHDLDMAYAYPSVLQHRGDVSSGGWGAHASACFFDAPGQLPLPGLQR